MKSAPVTFIHTLMIVWVSNGNNTAKGSVYFQPFLFYLKNGRFLTFTVLFSIVKIANLRLVFFSHYPYLYNNLESQ